MDQYKRIKVVGKGTFGQAVLVQDKKDGKHYIIKQINIASMSEREKQESLNEVKVLRGLRHTNIVQYIASFTEEGKLNIVMEYAECGDIYESIKKQKGTLFSEEQILDWFIQIALAVKYVHDKKILHRDLKTQNIFIGKNNVIKLGDFGIARVLKNTMEQAKTLVGTPYYLSPELCQEKPYNNKSDIWSLGCVLYEMVTHKHAFEGASMKALVGKILKGNYPPISSRYSSDLRGIIDKMLEKDPRNRPSINTVLKASFLQHRMRQLVGGVDLQSVPPSAEPSARVIEKPVQQPVKQEPVRRPPSAMDHMQARKQQELAAMEKLKQEKDRMQREALARIQKQKEIREMEDRRRNEDIRKMEEERRRITQQQEQMRNRQLEDLRKQKQLEEQKRLRQIEEQKKLEQMQLYNNRQPVQRNSYEDKRRIEEARQADMQRKRAFEDAKMEAFRNKQRLLEEPPRQSVPQRPPSSDRVSQNKRKDDEEKLAEARKQQYWEMRQQAERNKKRIEEQLYGFPTNGENGTKQPDERAREKDSETKWEQNKHRPPANPTKTPITQNTELIQTIKKALKDRYSSDEDFDGKEEKMYAANDPSGNISKFKLDGNTIRLKNVSAKDSLSYRIESLRVYLDDHVGENRILKAYRLLSNQGTNDDDDQLQEQLVASLGKDKLTYIPLLHQLVFYEHVLNVDSNA